MSRMISAPPASRKMLTKSSLLKFIAGERQVTRNSHKTWYREPLCTLTTPVRHRYCVDPIPPALPYRVPRLLAVLFEKNIAPNGKICLWQAAASVRLMPWELVSNEQHQWRHIRHNRLHYSDRKPCHQSPTTFDDPTATISPDNLTPTGRMEFSRG